MLFKYSGEKNPKCFQPVFHFSVLFERFSLSTLIYGLHFCVNFSILIAHQRLNIHKLSH